MSLLNEIQNASDEEVREINRILTRKLAKKIVWRASLVVATHIVATRLAEKFFGPLED